MNNNTVIVYAGSSQIKRDEPVVALVTGLEHASTNTKTGGMVQTYILHASVPPLGALQTGADAAICGGCKHRHNKQGRRTCYVQVGQAPQSIYNAYLRGSYSQVTLAEAEALCAGRPVRLGSYGDPVAVPIEVWQALVKQASGWTGYTHQWRAKRFQAYKDLCMASVDSEAEAREAVKLGWGYFLVRAAGDITTTGNEELCPASVEAGKILTCEECLACDGVSRKQIVIAAHGAAKNFV